MREKTTHDTDAAHVDGDPVLEALAAEVIEAARRARLSLAAAESCTGGLVLGALTSVAGSSDVVIGGLVTYSNAAKTQLLGVPSDLIDRHGAVSAPVALAMAQGALEACRSDLAVAVSGVAGPGGGTPEKPVGRVEFALARRTGASVALQRSYGDLGRAGVRRASVIDALALLRDASLIRSTP